MSLLSCMLKDVHCSDSNYAKRFLDRFHKTQLSEASSCALSIGDESLSLLLNLVYCNVKIFFLLFIMGLNM